MRPDLTFLKEAWNETLGTLTSALVISVVVMMLDAWLLFFHPFRAKSDVWVGVVFTPLVIGYVCYTVWRVLKRERLFTLSMKWKVAATMAANMAGAILGYAAAYKELGLIDGDVPRNDPVTCLYFSIVTWTTLGYGDVRPSEGARLVAASEALVGYISMAVIIGLFAELFAQIRVSSSSASSS